LQFDSRIKYPRKPIYLEEPIKVKDPVGPIGPIGPIMYIDPIQFNGPIQVSKPAALASDRFDSTIFTYESARPLFAIETIDGFELYSIDEMLKNTCNECGECDEGLSPHEKYRQIAAVLVDKNGDALGNDERELILQKTDANQITEKLGKTPERLLGPKIGDLNTECRQMFDQDGNFYLVNIVYDHNDQIIDIIVLAL
jgi:hypothetical protein